MTKTTTYLTLAVVSCVLFSGADWLRFRGPNGSGVADKDRVPVTWSVENQDNVAWQVDLPGRGSSCPIVIDDHVVVTCASGYRQDRLHIVCFDANEGQQLWHRQLWATGRTVTHSSICPAAPTPVSDGERIYAYFSSNDIGCFDLDGNLLWVRGLMLEYPNASNSLGLASSPIVVEDTLVVKIENDSQSLAVGLDTLTGQTKWKVDRPALSCWTSPVVLHSDNAPPVVLLQSGHGMTAYDPNSGEEVWKFDDGCATIPSSVAVGDVAFVPSNGLVALRQTRSAAPEVLWKNPRLGPSTPTPLLYHGRLFTLSGSVLTCADAQTGELIWRQRLKGSRFSSSPVAAGGHIYIFNDDGAGQVIVADEDEGRVVGGGDLGETLLGTPAIANNALYIRSDQHLWKIADAAASDQQ